MSQSSLETLHRLMTRVANSSSRALRMRRPDNLRLVRSRLGEGSPLAYLAMAGLVAAATGMRVAIDPYATGIQFPTFFLAVIIATFLGGVLVGLASIALSALAAWLFVLPPPLPSLAVDLGVLFVLATFVLVAVVMVFTIGMLQATVLGLEEGRHRTAMLDERARATEELRHWMDVIENVDFGISVVDPASNTISFANRTFATLHGLPLDGVAGLSLFDMYPPVERDRVALLCDTADRVGSVEFEAERSRNGAIFPARIHATSVHRTDGASLYRIVTVSDISHQRELEAELHQAQRLEAIGQLTAGVAHDFNNLLQGIIANLELLDDEIQHNPPARQLVNSILRIAEHGGALTRHLLSFSRQQVLRPVALDLDAFFRTFHAPLSRTLDPRIQVRMVADKGLPPVWVDAAHLETALLNLAINARDAMPSGGTLLIEASSGRPLGAGRPEHAGADSMAVIRVSDTGTGIAPDILAKVCEPFFTTKGMKGSGLGLSMVYGFAKQSGGELRITSEPDRGTTVDLWLPAMPALTAAMA